MRSKIILILAALFAVSPFSERTLVGAEHLFPEDSNMVAVFNLREIFSSRAYRRTFAKFLLQGLKEDGVEKVFYQKLKQAQRLWVIHNPTVVKNAQPPLPTIMIEGEFDSEKMKALAKKHSKETFTYKEHTVYRMPVPKRNKFYHGIVLGNNFVVLANSKKQAEAILDRSSKNNKTIFQDKLFAKLYGQRKLQSGLFAVVGSDCIVGGEQTGTTVNGKLKITSSRVLKLEETTGLKAIQVRVDLDLKVHGKITMVAATKEKAEMILQSIKEGIQTLKREKKSPHLLKALDSVRLSTKGPIITMEIDGSAQGIVDLFSSRSSKKPRDVDPKSGETDT